MGALKSGDKVVVNRRSDWPQPPGYEFEGAEGTVIHWVRYGETLEGFSDFVQLRIDKAEGWAAVYVGGSYCFRADDLVRVISMSEAGL